MCLPADPSSPSATSTSSVGSKQFPRAPLPNASSSVLGTDTERVRCFEMLPDLKAWDSHNWRVMSHSENVRRSVLVTIMYAAAVATRPLSYSKVCDTFRPPDAVDGQRLLVKQALPVLDAVAVDLKHSRHDSIALLRLLRGKHGRRGARECRTTSRRMARPQLPHDSKHGAAFPPRRERRGSRAEDSMKSWRQ